MCTNAFVCMCVCARVCLVPEEVRRQLHTLWNLSYRWL